MITPLSLHRTGPAGAKALAAVCAVRLTTLNLANNRLCGVWINYDGKGPQGTYTAEGILAVTSALRFNGRLRSISLLVLCALRPAP